MNKVTVFDYEAWEDGKKGWYNEEEFQEMKDLFKPFRNTRVVRLSMGSYRILASQQGLTAIDKYVKSVDDTDNQGYSIERGIEWIKDNGLFNEMLFEFFGIKEYDDERHEWLVKACEEYMQMLLDTENELALKWIKEYCLYDLDVWEEWLREMEYEVEL